MALSKAPVSRQAPKARPTLAQFNAVRERAASVENSVFEEDEEPVEVPSIPRPSRLTVNGLAVKRLLLEFGKETTAYYPGNDLAKGSVIERFWDQYDSTEDMDKMSRPRQFCDAIIDVNTNKGYLDITVSWRNKDSITKIVQPSASLHYDV